MNIQEMGDQIKVTIPKNREDTIPLTFTVNGESVTVPRGEEVTIPAMFAGAIKNWWKSQFYENGEDDASLKGEGGAKPFILNMDTFDKTSAEAGDKVVQAFLDGRPIYMYSSDTNGGADRTDFMPCVDVALPIDDCEVAYLSYMYWTERREFDFKTTKVELGNMNPYVKEFNV